MEDSPSPSPPHSSLLLVTPEPYPFPSQYQNSNLEVGGGILDASRSRERARTVLDSLQAEWQSAQTRFEEDLFAYQLPPLVAHSFRLEANIASSFVFRVEWEYKRFLLLRALAKPATPLVPPLLVFWLWRAHAAETREFAHFCSSVFREPSLDTRLHHFQAAREADYRLTQRLYAEVFDSEPSADVWPHFAEQTQFLADSCVVNVRAWMTQFVKPKHSAQLRKEKSRNLLSPSQLSSFQMEGSLASQGMMLTEHRSEAEGEGAES